jgi:hypothetical protein
MFLVASNILLTFGLTLYLRASYSENYDYARNLHLCAAYSVSAFHFICEYLCPVHLYR